MKKSLIILVIGLHCTCAGMEFKLETKNWYMQGLKKMYADLALQYEETFKVVELDNSYFLRCCLFDPEYPLLNIVSCSDVTEDIIKRAQQKCSGEKGIMPHCFIVDDTDVLSRAELSDEYFAFDYVEMVVEKQSIEEPPVTFDGVKECSKQERDLKDVVRILLQTPGFGVGEVLLAEIYQKIALLDSFKAFKYYLQSQQFKDFFEEGMVSSYAVDDVGIILGVSTGKKFDRYNLQKLIYKCATDILKQNENAKVAYLGTETEYDILKFIGFKKLQNVKVCVYRPQIQLFDFCI